MGLAHRKNKLISIIYVPVYLCIQKCSNSICKQAFNKKSPQQHGIIMSSRFVGNFFNRWKIYTFVYHKIHKCCCSKWKFSTYLYVLIHGYLHLDICIKFYILFQYWKKPVVNKMLSWERYKGHGRKINKSKWEIHLQFKFTGSWQEKKV